MAATPRQILVHLDPTQSSPKRLALARSLADRFDARLAALYGATPTLVTLPYPGDLAGFVAADLARLDGEHRDKVFVAFQEALRGPGAGASWAHTEAVPTAGTFARQALHADLLVLGQPDPADPMSLAVPPGFVPDVLAASGRPALVVPYIGTEGAPGRRIAIAWKETRESARALTAALPFLIRAERVDVLAWGERGNQVEGAALDLDGYLDAYGVKARWHTEPQEPAGLGELLLSRVSDLGADLLVMGCYGHTRAREWVLGGASRTVLSAMTVPVLMAH